VLSNLGDQFCLGKFAPQIVYPENQKLVKNYECCLQHNNAHTKNVAGSFFKDEKASISFNAAD